MTKHPISSKLWGNAQDYGLDRYYLLELRLLRVTDQYVHETIRIMNFHWLNINAIYS